MKVNLQPYKGARDFYPEEKRAQRWMFDVWSRVVELYGYELYGSPMLEPTDLYLMKGSEEIVNNQTFTFEDRGKRSVTIRTEMTPSLTRMVAGRRQELSYPARWYSIPNLWRYERMQRGRLREFWQLNVDLFGVKSSSAELEMLHIIDDLFQTFKAQRTSYVIKVNSRVLINTMLGYTCGMGTEQTTQLIRAIDKKNKLTTEEFESLINNITKHHKKTQKVLRLLDIRKIKDLPKELLESPSVRELSKLIKNCQNLGIRNLEFDISLTRGFDYYTDIVFEAFDTDKENSRSLLGGGRYDGLVGQFGVDPVPTVGFAVGDVGFMNFLNTHKLLPELKPSVDARLIIKNETAIDYTQNLARKLRNQDINISVDYSNKKIEAQHKSAIKAGTRYIVFVDIEGTSEKLVLKDTKTAKEFNFTSKQLVDFLNDNAVSRKK